MPLVRASAAQVVEPVYTLKYGMMSARLLAVRIGRRRLRLVSPGIAPSHASRIPKSSSTQSNPLALTCSMAIFFWSSRTAIDVAESVSVTVR